MNKITFLSICIILLNLKVWAQVPTDSLNNKLLEEDTFREYVPMDTIWEGSNFSEYIYKGIIQFNTQKNIIIWLDSLSAQLGEEYINFNSMEFESLPFFKRLKKRLFKSKKIHFDTLSWLNNFEWRNKKYFGVDGVRILMKIYKNDTPKHYNVVMYFFDRNNDLIEDSTLINIEKERIKRTIFDQKDKTFNNNIINKTITIGKSRYFSYWNSYYPENFDSIMKTIYYDKSIHFDFNKLETRCLVNKNGKVLNCKITNNNDDLDTNIDISLIEKYYQYFRFPKLTIDSIENYIVQFEFKNIVKDSLSRSIFYSKFESLFDSTFVDSTNTLKAFDDYNLGKFQNTRLLNWGNNIEIFSKDTNNKWLKVYNINTDNDDYYCLDWFDIFDINQDGHNDLIVSTCPNMNGNTWKDLYLYIPEKDSFHLKETGICINKPYFEDSTLTVKKGFLIAEYGGSWYMPNTRTVYKWDNYELEIEMIIGKELLLRDMMQGDDPIYFVYKKVNGKLTLVKQHNLYGSGILESHFEENELLAPYLEKK